MGPSRFGAWRALWLATVLVALNVSVMLGMRHIPYTETLLKSSHSVERLSHNFVADESDESLLASTDYSTYRPAGGQLVLAARAIDAVRVVSTVANYAVRATTFLPRLKLSPHGGDGEDLFA